MRFESRDLPPFIETVEVQNLVIGNVYFSISYVDDELQLPIVLSLVYAGKDLSNGDKGNYYFQDLESYSQGARFGDPSAVFYTQGIIDSIQEYEKALEELLRCSLRRELVKKRGAGEVGP